MESSLYDFQIFGNRDVLYYIGTTSVLLSSLFFIWSVFVNIVYLILHSHFYIEIKFAVIG